MKHLLEWIRSFTKGSSDTEEFHDALLLGSCGASQIQQALDSLRRACAVGCQTNSEEATCLIVDSLRPFTLAFPEIRKAFEDIKLAGTNSAKVFRLIDDLDFQMRLGFATWDDLYHLEKIVLEVASEQELQRRKIELLSDFNLYAGPTLKAKYEGYSAGLHQNSPPVGPASGKTPNPALQAGAYDAATETSALRHECLFLQHLIHDILTMRPHQERKRVDINGVLLQCTCSLILISGVVGAGIWWMNGRNSFPFVVFILWAGIIGACISATMRLQDSAREGMMLLNTTRHAKGLDAYFPSILLGAGAGFLAYLILLAGFGTINLTSLTNGKEQGTPSAIVQNFWKFLLEGPESAVDQAKTLVFAFMAGFLERFVPDTIDHVRGLGVKKR